MQVMFPKPGGCNFVNSKGELEAYECLLVNMSIEELPVDVVPVVEKTIPVVKSKPNHLKVVT